MMVGILCVVDTTHSIVAIYEAWRMCVTNFNMPESLRFVDWAVPFTSIATSLSALVTQIFLGHRVFQLTKSKPLIAVLAVLCLGSFVFGCIAGIKAYVIREIADFGPLIPLVIARFSLLSCADLLIAVVLIYALSRSKTDFRRTDKIINSLIRNAIQSGLLVTIVSLGDLFLFAFFSSTNLYSLFVYPLGRIYTSVCRALPVFRARRLLISASRPFSTH
ncbi:hypothetical protein B0H11DRAFT_1947892 [Mycena galericulata]|nr:hypothetical protein B0H11DRAFT_1947892 [Mycena galericulata]